MTGRMKRAAVWAGVGLLLGLWATVPDEAVLADPGQAAAVSATASSAKAHPRKKARKCKAGRTHKKTKKCKRSHKTKRGAAKGREGDSGATKASAEAAAKPHKRWVCPMDGYVSDHPGKCPRCGMDLVEEDH